MASQQDVTFKVQRTAGIRTYKLVLDSGTTLKKAREVLGTRYPGSVTASDDNREVVFLRGSRIVTASEETRTRLFDVVPNLFTGNPPQNLAFRYKDVSYGEVGVRKYISQ